jgi:sec-independent protein translocase protein TatB
MLDVSWQELFLIGVVALIVIGPKDMPQVMRAMAGLVRKARALSREFQNGMAEMMREAELDDLRRKLDEGGRVDLDRTVKDTLDPTGTLREEFDPSEFADRLRRSVEEPRVQRPVAATPLAGDQPKAAGDALAAAEEPKRPAPAGPSQGGGE